MKKKNSLRMIVIIATIIFVIIIAIIKSCGKEPVRVKVNEFEVPELNGQRLF